MNLAITKALEQRTDSVVKYETDSNGDTTYFLTKPVNGKEITILIKTPASFNASLAADAIVDDLFLYARKQFAEVRKGKSNE